MDEDTLIQHVINRFSADELCELLGLEPEDIVEKFYDEILSNSNIREAIGLDGYESED